MHQNNKYMIAGSYLPAIISIIILVFFDQISKFYITTNFQLYDSIPIINNVIELHYIRNYGAAWGILQNKQILFYIITIIVLLFMSAIYIKITNLNKYKDIKIVLIFIISGALGNFIDRVRLQYVIDFIYFKIINFPVFNIADCYVTLSFIYLIIIIIFKYNETDFELILGKK